MPAPEQACGEGGIGQMMLGRKGESSDAAPRGRPAGHRVEQEEPLERLSIRLGRRARGSGALSRGRRVANGLVRGDGGRRRGVRDHPAEQCRRRADAMAHLFEVTLGEPREVRVELQPQGARGERAHARQARADDLVGVVSQPNRGATRERRTASIEERADADRRFRQAPLREAHGPHAERGDSAGAGVGGLFGRYGGAGEEVTRRSRTSIHRPSDEVPQRRRALPFVEENGRGSLEHASRVRGGQGELSGIVELSDGRRSPGRRGGLADAFGAFQGKGRQSGKELVQLVVDDSRP